MRLLFVCGGSGGHINPALAIAEKLRELLPETEFLFVGGDGNIELELVPRAGYNIESVTAASLRRGIKPADIAHNVHAVFRIQNALWQSKKIIKEFKPDIAIGTGGYVCYPIIKTAKKLGIPTVVHSSDVLPGLTIRTLEKHTDLLLLGFEESKRYLKNSAKTVLTGTPVRGGFRVWDKNEARKQLNLPPDQFIVASYWGSLGALYMNRTMVDIISRNESSGEFYHIHATGNGEEGLQTMLSSLKERGIEKLKHTDLRSYIYDMPKVMAAADLVICRSGASTMSELLAMKKPSVLIPSAYVTGNHQEKNARVMHDKKAAIMIKEHDCSADLLYKTITDTLADKNKLDAMTEAMKKMDYSNSADKTAEAILSMIST